MSGPKVSVYSLSLEEQRHFAEQNSIIQETTICVNNIMKELANLLAEASKVKSIIASAKSRYSSMCSTCDLSVWEKELYEIELIIQKYNSELASIKTRFKTDKPGVIKLTAEMDREREGKLKAVKSLYSEIIKKTSEVRNIKHDCLAGIEAADADLMQQLQAEISSGFSVSFSGIRRKSSGNTAALNGDVVKSNTPGPSVEELLEKYSKKINGSLGTVAEALGENRHLSDDLKREQKRISELAEGITSADFLENFYAVSVMPFVKKCLIYIELLDKFEPLYDRYTALCEECGDEPLKLECSEASISFLKNEIPKLIEKSNGCKEKQYIDQLIDEAMEEMGYSLVGHKTVTKKSGAMVRHDLYNFGDGTGIDVTFSQNGQITMELGGFDESDRLPDENESNRLTEDMHKFCGDYAALERILEKKGVTRKNISLMPPKPEFAQIFNVSDYEMSKPISKFEVRKDKKSEIKAKHI